MGSAATRSRAKLKAAACATGRWQVTATPAQAVHTPGPARLLWRTLEVGPQDAAQEHAGGGPRSEPGTVGGEVGGAERKASWFVAAAPLRRRQPPSACCP